MRKLYYWYNSIHKTLGCLLCSRNQHKSTVQQEGFAVTTYSYSYVDITFINVAGKGE